jgi:hypothetical protein
MLEMKHIDFVMAGSQAIGVLVEIRESNSIRGIFDANFQPRLARQ